MRNPFDEEVSHFKQREREFRARRDDAATRARLAGDKAPVKSRDAAKDVDFETWLRRRYVARPWHGLLGKTPKRPTDFTAGAYHGTANTVYLYDTAAGGVVGPVVDLNVDYPTLNGVADGLVIDRYVPPCNAVGPNC